MTGTSVTPATGMVRIKIETLTGRHVLVGPFATLGGAKRMTEDLLAEQPPAVRSVRVEHRQRGHGWRPAWSWLTLAISFLLTVAGCATGGIAGLSSLGREVNLTPARGQRIEQIRQDDAECVTWTRATKGKDEPLPDATLRYAACTLARGYTVQPWGTTRLLIPGHEPISSPGERTLETVVADMRGCGAGWVEGYGLTDTWGSPAERRVACLTCLEQRGYQVERRKETSR
jgi:hypothetical protein